MGCFSAVKEVPPHLLTFLPVAIKPAALREEVSKPCKELVVKDIESLDEQVCLQYC